MGERSGSDEAIEVVAYDAGWAAAFAGERTRIAAALAGACEGIEHIGSTAVEGLEAKPIIDLMVGIAADARTQGGAVAALRGLGYERREEGDFPGRLFFRRRSPDGQVTHHLSLTVLDGGYWNDQLAFRDALRRDPELRRRYAALKLQLARDSPDRLSYTRGKTALVREALAAAGHEPATGWASER